jgi:hypothetical protein
MGFQRLSQDSKTFGPVHYHHHHPYRRNNATLLEKLYAAVTIYFFGTLSQLWREPPGQGHCQKCKLMPRKNRFSDKMSPEEFVFVKVR